MLKTLEVIVTSRIRAGKTLSIEPHSLSIALPDWTIKQERDIVEPPGFAGLQIYIYTYILTVYYSYTPM